MGKVLWHTTMSLDGFIAGSKGEMDWMFGHSGPRPEVFQEILRTTGAALTGRRSYDAGAKVGKRVYGGAFTGPVFVLTHQPPEDDDPQITFLTGEIATAVDTARAAAGDRNVVLIGANVAQQCIAAGLVDEVLVHVVPALVGDGTRLFDSPGTSSVRLETIDVAPSGDLVDLRYRVVGEAARG
ncbi:dihydrofolate reductase family protein [Micromonospora sp. NPDC050980]|uniref:dihydrofolate reductase family protein n=1 Tax=Micromonospora sp. NPDC050980 TaxID=3155161 RepID=UPI0033C9C5DA